jgi:hypothetical protein
MKPDSARAFVLYARVMGDSPKMMKKNRIPEDPLARRMGTDFLVVKLTLKLSHRQLSSLADREAEKLEQFR